MPPPRIRPTIRLLLSRLKHPNPPSFFAQRNPQPTLLTRLRLTSQTLSRLPLLHSSFSSTWHRPLLLTLKIFIVFHTFTSYLYTWHPTSGISMLPTIPHEFAAKPMVLESRLHRRGRNIGVGDVVTYTSPAVPFGNQGLKRVVGMPGDFVSVVSHARMSVEDVEKAAGEGDWATVKGEVVQVPEGHCWLAGDNLEWSRDSRVYGAVPLNLVKGKVLAVVWPPRAWKVLGGSEGLRDVNEGEEYPWVAA